MYERNSVRKVADYILKFGRDESPLIGLAGPQGSGKSTLCLDVQMEILESGRRCVVLCLDDFYYTKAKRLELGDSVHSMLYTRGVPGTHDIEDLIDVIHAIRRNTVAVKWPKFNKAIDDRDPNQVGSFTPFPEQSPIIILEGWCVGCLPANSDSPINQLETVEDPHGVWRSYVNDQIKTRYVCLWRIIDTYIYIEIPDWSFVSRWRQQQAVSNQETSFDLHRFMQFFERLSRSMMYPSGRIAANITVRMAADHSIQDIILH